MGYGNYNKWVKLNPKIDKFYWCSKCGVWNDPFYYKDKEFEEQSKKNLCPKCKEKLNKNELFGHEKATKETTGE